MEKKNTHQIFLIFLGFFQFSRNDMISFGPMAIKVSGMSHFQAEAVRNQCSVKH